MKNTVKCLQKNQHDGNIDNLFWGDRELSLEIGTYDVLVRVNYIGLNFKDALFAFNKLSYNKIPIDFGFECVGQIIAVGNGITNLRLDDRVALFHHPCACEYVKVPANQVVKIPDKVSDTEAATIPVAFLTAYHALIDIAALKQNQTVLIHSASGGVGQAALQIAKMIGTEIFATAGSANKREWLVNQGITHVYDSRNIEYQAEIIKITNGKGVNAIIGVLTKEHFNTSLEILCDGGIYLDLGQQYKPADFLINKTHNKFIRYHALRIDAFMPDLNKNLNKIFSLLNENILKPLSYQLYSYKDFKNAFRAMINPNRIGKIILAINSQTKNTNIKKHELDSASLQRLYNEGITPAQGMQLLELALNSEYKQLAITTGKSKPYLINESYDDSLTSDTSMLKIGKDQQNKHHSRDSIKSSYISPTNLFEEVCVQLWEDCFNLKPIGILDNFDELGGDSLIAVDLALKIKTKLNVDIGPYQILDANTISLLYKNLSLYRENIINLQLLQANNHDNTLIFIHPGHGATIHYKKLCAYLNWSGNIYTLENHVTNDLYKSMLSIESLADEYLTIIPDELLNNNLILAGWSMGGVIAYEMAQRLLTKNIKAKKLLLFDTWAKYTPRFDSHNFFNAIYKNRLKNIQIINDTKIWLDLLWLRLKVLLQYNPKKIIIDTILFKANEISEEYQDIDDPTNHWFSFIDKSLRIVNVNGSHESMMDEENIIKLAEKINNILNDH